MLTTGAWQRNGRSFCSIVRARQQPARRCLCAPSTPTGLFASTRYEIMRLPSWVFLRTQSPLSYDVFAVAPLPCRPQPPAAASGRTVNGE